MRPVVELKARIIQVRTRRRAARPSATARPGPPSAPSRIAIVAVGYADGYLRSAGAADQGRRPRDVIVAGKRCPIVGRISMDLMAVDVTDLPEGAVAARRPRDADRRRHRRRRRSPPHAGTIGYEVLTSLGRRYHRVYKGA